MGPVDVARAILDNLLVDATVAATTADEVAAWVASRPADVGEHGIAWAAARATERALDLIGGGVAARPGPEIIGQFRDLPVASRVAVALHEFCGLDDSAIAAATARPVEEITALLDGVGEDTPPAAAPPSAPTPFGPGAHSHPAPASRPATPVPFGPGATRSSPPDPPPATPVPRPSDPFPQATSVRGRSTGRVRKRRRSSKPRWWVIAVAVVLALIAGGIALSNTNDKERAPRARGPMGVGESTTVRRDQLSPGCATAAGDIALEPQIVETTSSGTPRRYRINAPAAMNPGEPRSLLVMFGDLGQTVDDAVADAALDILATAHKVVVVNVAPIDSSNQWNLAGDRTSPDMAFTSEILEAETQRLCIDQTRIVLGGRGAGAHFAAAYTCRNPGSVHGLVLVAGVYRSSTCPTPDRLSILAIVGSNDAQYPFKGGTGPMFDRLVAEAGGLRTGADYSLAPVGDTLDAWAESLDCVTNTRHQVGVDTVHLDTSCANQGEVWRVVVDGAGHEWYPSTFDVLVEFLFSNAFPVG